MMRAGRDYLTKGVAGHGAPRDRLVKRGAAKRLPGPKGESSPKRQATRKPPR